MTPRLRRLLGAQADRVLGTAPVDRRVRTGTAGSFVLQVSSAGLGFLVSLALARWLGVRGFGVYSYVVVLVGFLSIPAVMGLDNLVVRFGSAARATQSWGEFRGLVRWSNVLGLCLSLLIAGIAVLVVWLRRPYMNPQAVAVFWLGVATLPLIVLIRLRQFTLRAVGRVVVGQVPEQILSPALMLAGITAVELLRPALTVELAMAVNVCALLVCFGVGAHLLRRSTPPGLKAARSTYEHRLWIRSAGMLFLVNAAQATTGRSDVLILGALKGASAVGVYGVAVRVAGVISLLQMASTTALAPEFAALHARGNREEIQRVARRSARLVSAGGLAVVIVCALFGRQILSIFGPAFALGAPSLVVLALGNLASVVVGPVGSVMLMTGHAGQAATSIAVSAGLNIALDFALIPPFGVQGAAVASSLGTIAWNLLMLRFALRLLGISSAAIGPRGSLPAPGPTPAG